MAQAPKPTGVISRPDFPSLLTFIVDLAPPGQKMSPAPAARAGAAGQVKQAPRRGPDEKPHCHAEERKVEGNGRRKRPFAGRPKDFERARRARRVTAKLPRWSEVCPKA